MRETIRLDAIATHGRARASTVALIDLATGRRWTWRELDAATNRTARWLHARLGARSGARVAALAKNCADMLILQRACARAGTVFVPFNWRLGQSEVAALLADAEPALLLCGEGFDAPGFTGERLALNGLDANFAAMDDTPLGAVVGLGWDEPWTLLYTSGTSGSPKGVVISQANAFWGATNFIHGNGVSSASVFLCDMPLFHTAGLFVAAGVPLLAGATLLVSDGFEPARTLATIADRRWGVTHYFSVPQMAQMLWNQPGFAPDMLSGLQVYATGGAPNPRVQIERFARAGIMMADGFGMTETCSNFAMPVDDPEILIAKAGSIGLPLIAVGARIVDDDGRPASDGETGELQVRGPSVTAGYWGQPELTAAAFAGEWFRTGDAAYRDADGFYFLVDRKKDMFISGGENVYPAEVEAVIAELPEVAECAVIGVPDERWGEVGRAYVIAVPGSALRSEDVHAHCAVRIARFKIPKTIVITDAIPRTASGKVQKHLLRTRALEEMGV